jgi:hypothetical protein
MGSSSDPSVAGSLETAHHVSHFPEGAPLPYMCRRTLLVTLLMVGCGTSVSDDTVEDSGTSPDGSRADAAADAHPGNDSGSKDSSTTDSAVSDSSTDDASDDGSDASMDSGAICPVCAPKQSCCLNVKSVNYGKCYATSCLACCM